MHSPDRFKESAHEALGDRQLAAALGNVRRNFVDRRRQARERLPEFDELRAAARAIKDHALAHLDLYLEAYEAKVLATGGQVHWAETAAEANAIVLDICRKAGARTVTKGKSMISEEIGLNAALAAGGIEPVETDLGEYIIQLRGEAPSHIIAPAVHLTKAQVEADFRRTHTHLAEGRRLEEPAELVAEARQVLRERFLAADVGITGANFLVAETGTSVIVTNEGNGDLTQTLPRVHIVLASLEKVVPTLADVAVILRVLARSATGQDISTYTTFSTGPRRPGDPDGPEAYHVVLLDGGRSEILASQARDILRCIRCGACMNHCPVYHAVGGHAYGSVYSGPMGAVLTPALQGIARTAHLPGASSFCGRCEEVCPMGIPLPSLMRHFRSEELRLGRAPLAGRLGLAAWGFLARRPALYHLAARLAARLGWNLAGDRGAIRALPLARGWTRHRDLPAPEGRTFQAMWTERRAREERT